jgi:replication-associated recombination protein RarA
VSDVHRLLNAELIAVAVKSDDNHPTTLYKLTDKGKEVLARTLAESPPASFNAVMSAFDLIVGFRDIKVEIAKAISKRQKVNFLLIGPPACAKSLFLEGIASAVPNHVLAFGSSTTASGLSDELFKKQPAVLELDEADKLKRDAYSVLLGLLERGDVIEVKFLKSRGIHLETSVYAACNRYDKFTPEFLSRFPWQVHFKPYTRSEFLDVCRGFLTRSSCPEDVAEYIGVRVFDDGLGDVRKVRGVWQAMDYPTKEEAQRVIDLQRKYAPGTDLRVKKQMASVRMF